MFANLRFSPVDLAVEIGTDGLHWWGRCKAEFVDYKTDRYIRGDVTFLNRIGNELHIHRREDGKLNRLCWCSGGVDERVSHGKAEGYYPDHYDLLVVRHYRGHQGPFLAMNLFLSDRKFDHFTDLLLRVVWRSTVIISVACDFHGFREEFFDVPSVPTKDEFLAGQPYLTSGDFRTTLGAVSRNDQLDGSRP